MSPDTQQLKADSRNWPSLTVYGEAFALVECMLRGALGPHPRFMSRNELEAARSVGAILLPAPASLRDRLHGGDKIALRDREGLMLAAMHVDEIWELSGTTYVAGHVTGIQLPLDYCFASLRHTAHELQDGFDQAFLATQPIHRATFDALISTGRKTLILGALPPDADPGETHPTVRCWLHAAARSQGQFFLSLWPLASSELPQGHSMAERIARSAGCKSLVLHQNLAGWEAHPEVVRLLRERRTVPEDLTFPEVAHHLAPVYPPRAEQGLTIFFTGLSGSGKSTIAKVLREALLGFGRRRITLLDGDCVRHHLSSELGFSREHRELNITRIGFVAAEITRHCGIAICVAIAPYEDVRTRVRGMVEAAGGFVLVHVATSLEVCEGRDVKGLYAKARSGVIPNFTGISDAYQPPAQPDIVIDTATVNPQQAVGKILTWLQKEGYIAAQEPPPGTR